MSSLRAGREDLFVVGAMCSWNRSDPFGSPSVPSQAALWLAALLVLVGWPAAPASSQTAFAPPPQPSVQPVRGLYDPKNMPTSPATRAPTGVLPSSPGAAPITPTPGVSPPVASQLGPQAQLLEGGQIIARIDGQTVLAGDVLWQVNQLVEANRDRIGPGQEAAFRDMLLKRQLLTIIDTKLLYADFRRTVPAENLPQVQETLAEGFRDREIPRLIKVLGLETQPELEAKLESYGTNLRDARQRFTENAIAGEWLRQRTPKPKEITHHEMLTYYQEHLTDYDYPAKARWEELMIRFDRVGGDQNRAWRPGLVQRGGRSEHPRLRVHGNCQAALSRTYG